MIISVYEELAEKKKTYDESHDGISYAKSPLKR